MSTEQTDQQMPTNGGASVINTPPEEQTIMTPIDTLLASAPTSLSIEGVGIDTANLDPTDYFDADGYVRHCISCLSGTHEETTYTDIETEIDGGDLGSLNIELSEVEVEVEIDLEEAVANSYCGSPPDPSSYFDVSELQSSGEVTCQEFFAAHTAKTEDPRVLVLQAIEYMVEQRTGQMVAAEELFRERLRVSTLVNEKAELEEKLEAATTQRSQLATAKDEAVGQSFESGLIGEKLAADLEWALTVLATLQVSDEVRHRAAAANCTLVAALRDFGFGPRQSGTDAEGGTTDAEGVSTPADWTSPNTVDTNTEES